MKIINYLIFLFVIFFVSCTNDGNKTFDITNFNSSTEIKTALLAKIKQDSSYCNVKLVGSLGDKTLDLSNMSRIRRLDLSGIKDLTSINNFAFKNCRSLESITIPNTVTSIGSYVFAGCTSLKFITIPSSVTDFNTDAFSGCKNLESIDIQSAYVDYDVLKDLTNVEINITPDHPILSSDNGVLFNKESRTLLRCPKSKKGAYEIPDYVNIIDKGAFEDCSGLTSLTIKHGTTVIGLAAFRGCSGLTSLTIPGTVTKIGDYAFQGCTSLKCVDIESPTLGEYILRDSRLLDLGVEINITSDSSTLSSENGILFNKDKTELLRCPKSKQGVYEIPSSVTSIGYEAFSGCNNLRSVIIPSTMTSIDNSAFREFSGLTSLTIPNTITKIGPRAFMNCRRLKSITIPSSVTTLCESSFEGCDSLKSVDILSTSIDYITLYISKLAGYELNITPYHSTLSSENGVLFNVNKTKLLICPKSKRGAYKIPNTVTSISGDAFSGCYHLTSITIPNSVISIGNYAFSGCFELTSLTIPNSVTHIGDGAFESCASLTSLTIPNTITCIRPRTFKSCGSLKSVTIPSSVKVIQENAFEDCYSLKSLTLPNSITDIERYAFYGCSSLTSLTIPNSVICMGVCPFDGCESLTSLTFKNSRGFSYQMFKDLPTTKIDLTLPSSEWSRDADDNIWRGGTFKSITYL